MWIKSSYSNGGDNCLEVAFLTRQVALRDSKSPALGTLTLSAASFTALIRKIKAGT